MPATRIMRMQFLFIFIIQFMLGESITECLFAGHDVVGWYDGETIDFDNNIWSDKSAYGNHGILDSTDGIGVTATDIITDELYVNGYPVVHGSTATKISFPVDLNPENYTVFNLCKYRAISGGSKGRILQTSRDNALFGFWSIGSQGGSGLAFSAGWITQYTENIFGDEWVLSSQQYNWYRGNRTDLTSASNAGAKLNYADNQLMINQGLADADSELSDFACAEIIVSNDKLSLGEVECIENYLYDKYLGALLPTPEPTDYPTVLVRDCTILDIDGFLTECSNEFPSQISNIQDAVNDLETDLTLNISILEARITSLEAVESGVSSQMQLLTEQVTVTNARIDEFGVNAAKVPSVGFIDDNGKNDNIWLNGINGKHILIFISSLLLINFIGMIYIYYLIYSKGKRTFDGKAYTVQSDEETDMEPINIHS